MPSTCAVLEAALAADPDDVALHSAYADLLIEEGDPRGEFIRLELELEDPSLTHDERLREFEVEGLRRRHDREWLGAL